MGKSFKITVNARTYDIEVGSTSENPVEVLVDGELFLVEVEKPAEKVVLAPTAPAPSTPAVTRSVEPPKAAKGPVATDARVITAPMPGVVLAVKVKSGEKVKTGEEVCTLESMKMELNIMAARDGVVSKVCVSVGQSVVHGTVLIELE